jgi:hypothetical protein
MSVAPVTSPAKSTDSTIGSNVIIKDVDRCKIAVAQPCAEETIQILPLRDNAAIASFFREIE